MRSKMQSLSENSPDLIIRLNTAGQFFYANPTVERYLNIPVWWRAGSFGNSRDRGRG